MKYASPTTCGTKNKVSPDGSIYCRFKLSLNSFSPPQRITVKLCPAFKFFCFKVKSEGDTWEFSFWPFWWKTRNLTYLTQFPLKNFIFSPHVLQWHRCDLNVINVYILWTQFKSGFSNISEAQTSANTLSDVTKLYLPLQVCPKINSHNEQFETFLISCQKRGDFEVASLRGLSSLTERKPFFDSHLMYLFFEAEMTLVHNSWG